MDARTEAAIRKLRENRGFAERLMRSKDGKKLMELLSGSDGGEQLERAAQSAAQGDTRELAGMLRGLMKNGEAEALMRRLNDTVKR